MFAYLRNAFKAEPEERFPYKKGALFKIGNPEWFSQVEWEELDVNIPQLHPEATIDPDEVIDINMVQGRLKAGDLLEFQAYDVHNDTMIFVPLGEAFKGDIITIGYDHGRGLRNYTLETYKAKHDLIVSP